MFFEPATGGGGTYSSIFCKAKNKEKLKNKLYFSIVQIKISFAHFGGMKTFIKNINIFGNFLCSKWKVFANFQKNHFKVTYDFGTANAHMLGGSC